MCGVFVSAVLAPAFGADYTDINVSESAEHEVRYTSGKTIYVEGLVKGQWMGRYWGADGRLNFPYWKYEGPAFDLKVKSDPAATESKHLADGWQWISAREAGKTERGSRHFIVMLKNEKIPLTVDLHTLLDETCVLVRWLSITNNAEKAVAITEVSPWSSRLWPVVHPFTLGYQTKDNPGQEGWVHWQSLPKGITAVESVKGNGQDDPFFIVRNETKGEYFIGHLAWSANWRMTFDLRDGGLYFKMEPTAKDALRVIAPSETVHSPALHLGHVEGDLDRVVQGMHTHLRRSVLPEPRPNSFRVQYVIPGDQGYSSGADYVEANMFKHIDVAAEIGAEMFVMDAGWYDTYGDWVPSPGRFPNGLEPIRKYAQKKGLLFGLQTEAEGGRRGWSNSKAAKGNPGLLGPQDVLRLDQAKPVQHILSELGQVVETYKIDLYRHEFIPAGLPGQDMFTHEWVSTDRFNFQENAYWRYYEGYNRIWDALRGKYPQLILQHCANGGTRDDVNNMARFHETYSNEGELNRVLPSYSGKTLSLPPEILTIGGGARLERGHLDTYLRFTFTLQTPWLHSGVAPGLENLGRSIKEKYIHSIQLYKNFIRPILPTSLVYHHAPMSAAGGVTSTPWFVMEFTSPDRNKGWVTIVRQNGAAKSDTYLFKPRGLSPAKTYRVTFDNIGATVPVSGLQLMQQGLSVRLESTMSSELILFETK